MIVYIPFDLLPSKYSFLQDVVAAANNTRISLFVIYVKSTRF